MEIHEPDFSYTGIYTYADYLKWTIEERLELIKGKLFRMSPAPNRMHQWVSGKLFYHLYQFLQNNKCQVYAAPFDVRLPAKSKEDQDILTVVQPDICIVCDAGKLDDKGCLGAPDVIVEILSPGNNRKELENKYTVYEESGVKEYWIVSPSDKTCLVYRLQQDKKYPSRPLKLNAGDVIRTPLLPGFGLVLNAVFEGY